MAKITIKGLVRRGLIVETNPEEDLNSKSYIVSDRGQNNRMYILAGLTPFSIGQKFGLARGRCGVRAEKQESWRIVSSDKIISRYVMTKTGVYRYKCQGVLFLTSLEEALVQAGFDLDLFDAVC